MSALIRGNRDLIKEMNRNLLLNIIRREGRISRKQLTEVSGLSVGSVSGIANELLEGQWILEVGEGDYTGGRRQTLIKLNPEAGYAVGLKLMEKRLVVAITNFEAEILDYREEAHDFGPEPHSLAHALAAAVQSVIAHSGIPTEKLFGVGIGLAGVVQSSKGIVHYSPFFGWRDLPLAALIEAQIQLPVYIENDVNTLTLTEQLFGAGRHHANFAVVTVGRGIGLGLVINNQLYHGAMGGAGEIGHTLLMQSSDVEPYFKSLEEMAADPAVLQAVQAQHLAEVVERANAGDEQARQALRRSGEALGVGLANLVNTLNPERVIISGEGTLAGDYRLQPMLETMKKHTFNGLLDSVDVIIEPTDDRVWARGAASLVISKVFESPMLSLSVDG